ncbi:2-nitropropane dioxygenase [Coprinopsis sp. MPI-PUGE-AT-0042]|nr:2-nitropropane dioxygenase [Coprinopsis sp. MPI-PUGE-AT-0042]
MAGASGGDLASQVSLAGGFGFLATGYGSTERLRSELDITRNAFRDRQTLPIGVGFLGWLLDKSEELAMEQLSLTLEYHVQAIWLAFGDRLEYWVDYIHQACKDKGSQYKPLICIQITSPQEATMAVEKLKADVIIAQGVEAGGHGAAKGTPLLSLVPAVLEVVPSHIPVLAAGGLVTGAHMAALLALGAAGIVVGTRFLTAPESQYTDGQRKALLDADSTRSVRTMAFDQARKTLGWPQGIDGRGLYNDTVADYDRGEDVEILGSRYQEAQAKDDANRIVVWAGTGVGLIDRIQSAKDIVNEIHEECLRRLSVVYALTV